LGILKFRARNPESRTLSDIRQIPGSFEIRIAPLIGLGNGKSPSSRQEAIEAGN
jgi:hypothetical protein